MPPLTWFVTANQSDCRPYWANCDAKASPLIVTLPALPCTVMATTRPPRSPRPLRCVTPTDSSVPIWG